MRLTLRGNIPGEIAKMSFSWSAAFTAECLIIGALRWAGVCNALAF